MPFKENNTYGQGRPKGALNVLNADSKEKLHAIYQKDLLDTFVEDVKSLNPYQRVQVFLKLSEFFIPKLRSEYVSLDIDSMSDRTAGNILAELITKYVETNEIKYQSSDGGDNDSPASN